MTDPAGHSNPLPALALALSLVAAGPARADFTVERIASGLTRPVFLTAPPADPARVFVAEQRSGTTGRIRVLDLSSLVLGSFLEIPGVSTGFEQGLLGMAFHPDYASNGLFYVNYTDSGGTTRIERYAVSGDPDVADPASAAPVLSIPQPQANHNGGWLGFGPDGYLYVSTGDGGGSNDSGSGHSAGTGNAQDTTANLLGKILRIDVDGDDFPADPDRNYAIPPDNPFAAGAGDDEIWAYGLRNPWRASFDRLTGDLYIADVGQGAREEIDVQPAASPGGENYGWRLREGTVATPSGGVGGAPPAGAIDPIYDYTHGSGPLQGSSVTGGSVYRGPAPSLQGQYFFADFGNSRIWSLVWDGSAPGGFDGTNTTSFQDWTDDPHFAPDQGSLANPSSFGEDAAGNLYLLSLNGDVFRIRALATPLPALPLWLLAALGIALPALAALARRGR